MPAPITIASPIDFSGSRSTPARDAKAKRLWARRGIVLTNPVENRETLPAPPAPDGAWEVYPFVVRWKASRKASAIKTTRVDLRNLADAEWWAVGHVKDQTNFRGVIISVEPSSARSIPENSD